MIRQTVSTIALLAIATQAIDLLESIEPKADIEKSDYPTATWAFTKTGDLGLVDCMLDHSCNGNGNGSGSGDGSDNDEKIAKDRMKAATAAA